MVLVKHLGQETLTELKDFFPETFVVRSSFFFVFF